MKRLLIVCFILIAQGLFGQQFMNLVSNNEISIIGYWNKGEKVTYECSRIERDFKNGKKKPIKENIKSFDITLSVIDSSEKAYVLNMSYSNFKGIEIEEGELCNSLLSELNIKYVTDEFGAFDSIINKKELHVVLEELVKDLFKDVKDTSKINFIKQLFLNDSNLEALFVADIIMIHNLYGIGLKLSKPIEYELEFLTLENYELLGDGKVTLTSIDKGRNNAHIITTQRPNKDGVKDYINFLLKELVPDGSKEDLKVVNKATQSYDMELSSGWMKKIKSKSFSKVNIKGKEYKKEVVNSFMLKSF